MQSPQTFSAESGAQQKSAIGMQGNLAAALGYPVGILGLVSAIIEKDNKFVKFHGFQSVLWSIGMTIALVVLSIVLGILTAVIGSASGTLGTIFGLLTVLVYLGGFLLIFGGLIYAAIKAYGGQMFKLPIVGNMAEKFAFK
jgi:uncharacterized membrane protein